MYTTATLTTLIDSRGNGFNIGYEDFTRLLGTELAADKLLACLFRWTRWSDSNETPEQRAERNGWIRKSGRELFDEIKLTRSLYERARRKLRELGIVQCRHENAVHGMMTWKLDIKRLTELLITQVYGEPFVETDTQTDRDGFKLPEFVPLDLWAKHQKALY